MLRDIALAFRAERVTHALVGGMALAAQGVTRATMNVDFLIGEADLPASERALSRLGFAAEQRHGGFIRYVRHPLPELPGLKERVDVLVARHDLGRALIELAQRNPVGWEHGLTIPVMTVEGLLLMKILASVSDPTRVQDRVDMLDLLRLHAANIDERWVRSQCAALGPTFLEACDHALEEARNARVEHSHEQDFGL